MLYTYKPDETKQLQSKYGIKTLMTYTFLLQYVKSVKYVKLKL